MNENLTILFFGLEHPLADDLRTILASTGWHVDGRDFVSAADCVESLDACVPDLVFCASDRVRYRALLDLLEQSGRNVPLVVVSRLPEVSGWLDALDDGAADYCAPPFETEHVRWIVETNARRSVPATVRAAEPPRRQFTTKVTRA